MNDIIVLAQVRGFMRDVEERAGLTEISGLEREVLFACADLINKNELARTRDILSHRFLKGFSHPSVFRALKSLVNQNLLSHGKGLRGSYTISKREIKGEE